MAFRVKDIDTLIAAENSLTVSHSLLPPGICMAMTPKKKGPVRTAKYRRDGPSELVRFIYVLGRYFRPHATMKRRTR